MTGMGTIAGRRTAMTLVVAEPEGEGAASANVSGPRVAARTVSGKTS